MNAKNEEFLNSHSVHVFEFIISELNKGVSRQAIGIPEDVDVTVEEFIATIKTRNAARLLQIEALSTYEILTEIKDEAFRLGELQALDQLDLKVTKFSFDDYFEEIQKRIAR